MSGLPFDPELPKMRRPLPVSPLSGRRELDGGSVNLAITEGDDGARIMRPADPEEVTRALPDLVPGLDMFTPNVARMYDFYLGGKDNTRADQECAEEVMRLVPQTREIAWANRRFLGRAVRFLAGERGFDQFIDIGAGLPTRENVHEVAQRANPGARVVYADHDPVVVSHAQALLATDAQTRAITGDARDPDGILANDEVRKLLDLRRPVAVLLVAVLHFIPDYEEPYRAVGELMMALPSGSALVVSHVQRDPALESGAAMYERASSPAVLRTHAEIAEFFDGLALVDPGVVRVNQWRPDDLVLRSDPDVPFLGGVGVKP
jgi:hypothetical protein